MAYRLPIRTFLENGQRLTKQQKLTAQIGQHFYTLQKQIKENATKKEKKDMNRLKDMDELHAAQLPVSLELFDCKQGSQQVALPSKVAQKVTLKLVRTSQGDGVVSTQQWVRLAEKGLSKIKGRSRLSTLRSNA
ncbi:hypothetical protein QOT17_005770 [Balamuthia mandrillaris]